MNEDAQPIGERPRMAEGYLETKPLPWSWAERRLVRARNYWVATVTPKGRPHSRPVWGLWVDRSFCFSTTSRIAKNLDAHAEATIHLESGDECLIVEGTATRLQADAALLEAYQAKYGWDMHDMSGDFFRLRPRVVFAWLSDPTGDDEGVLFAHSATRWTFPG